MDVDGWRIAHRPRRMPHAQSLQLLSASVNSTIASDWFEELSAEDIWSDS